MSAWRRLEFGILLLLILLTTGVVGYAAIEGWSFMDALYMTVITVSTVGFEEVQPLSTGGRVFTIFLIILGVGTAFYILLGAVTIVIEGELGEAWGVRRMKSKIEALRNHYILCGFGRVGEEIGCEFKDRGIPFVVVESNHEAIGRAKQRNFLLIEGDASLDSTLLDAGIGHARALLAASDSDSGNTYITLTAKAMNPDVLVVARAGQPQNLERMRRAGADRVISPYQIGGRRMALSALQPLVLDFIDTLTGGRPEQSIIAEFIATPQSCLAGCTLEQAVTGRANAVVLAIQRPSGEILVGPPSSAVVGPEDRLIVLGREADMQALALPPGQQQT
ncbi:MAG TPA: potassium channel family protein [Dehalococcoidia bacterium]|nr:potassium channel family protein [Dehalococcoidia bacterium]